MSYADQLRAALSESDWAFLRHIAALTERLSQPLFLVGGPVRDCLLRRAVSDLDLTTEGDALALARTVAHEWGGTWKSFDRFGTTKVYLPGRALPIDIATTRTETYAQPGALPQVAPGSIHADLIRRDFTINAMALRLDGAYLGGLIDQFGGLIDLRNGVLRVLHPQSFNDDPTRILRGLRFEQRFSFVFAPETQALIPAALSVLAQLSGDRLRHEMELLFRETQPLRALQRMQATGALACIDPALTCDEWLAARFTTHAAPFDRFICWAWLTCRLDAASLTRFSQRVNLTRADAVDLAQVKAVRDAAEPIGALTRRSAIYRAVHAYHDRALRAALTVVDQAETQHNLALYLNELCEIKPVIDGDRLQALGMPSGPEMGRLLAQLHDAWLDGEIVTPRQAEDYARQVMKRKG